MCVVKESMCDGVCVCVLYLHEYVLVLHICMFPCSMPANERVSISAHVLYVMPAQSMHTHS